MMSQGNQKYSFGIIECDVVIGASGDAVFKTGVQRYTGGKTVKIVGLCMMKIAVRRETIKGGVVGKRIDWIGSSGQEDHQ